MKTRLAILTVIFALWCGVSGARIQDQGDQKGPSSEAQPTEKTVNAKDLEGSVEVSFSVDAQGKIRIVEIVASSQELADYVIKKMSNIQLDKNDASQQGKIIKYRFLFKKQA